MRPLKWFISPAIVLLGRIFSVKRPFVGIFKLIWFVAILMNEIIWFKAAFWNCNWDHNESWPSNVIPYHVAIISDPQIVDFHSYGRTGIIQAATEYYTDRYIRREWLNLLYIRRPDAVIFLGDLMDGGREWEDDVWYKEFYRFRALFSYPTGFNKSIPTFYLVGNHDIGFGDGVRALPYARFIREFGKVNFEARLGNHSIVAIDTVSLSGSSVGKKEAENFLNQYVNNASPGIPRILFTHVPLDRPATLSCGPLRQSPRPIRQGVGYEYQNLIKPDISSRLLTSLHPVLVLSGDDHDYCEILHDVADSANAIPEITVPAFSMASGVPRGGVVLLSLYYDPSSTSNIFTTYATSLCLFPNQIKLYLIYGVLFVFTLLTTCISPIIMRRLKGRDYESNFFGSLTQNYELLPTIADHDNFRRGEAVRQNGIFDSKSGAKRLKSRRAWCGAIAELFVFGLGIYGCLILAGV